MSALRLHLAGPADAPEIAAVQVAGWEAAYRGMIPDEAFATRTLTDRTAMWEGLLGGRGNPPAAPQAWVVLAGRGGEAVGFVSLRSASPAPEADPAGAADHGMEITALYVAPAAWRSGVGTALMRAVLAEASARGAPSIMLWVLEPNERARAFYARCGFSDDGGRQTAGAGWPPEVRMRRAL